MWDLIVSVPDHCLSFYFDLTLSLLLLLKQNIGFKSFFAHNAMFHYL